MIRWSPRLHVHLQAGLNPHEVISKYSIEWIMEFSAPFLFCTVENTCSNNVYKAREIEELEEADMYISNDSWWCASEKLTRTYGQMIQLIFQE